MVNFKARRQNPELVTPAKPTPHEFLPLSDLDDQEALRFLPVFIQFYHNTPSMEGKDPINVIRDAIANALVFYYPFAGRLRECGPRKLVVECSAEGVVFTGAYADVTLEEFGEILRPPFPNLEELIYDVPGSPGLIDCPLLLVQVTRLKCNGFIFAFRFNHVICDGAGIRQFLSAIGELARGAQSPSTPPVWYRHLLTSRCPPRVTFNHPEYTSNSGDLIVPSNLLNRSFLFDAGDISALRRILSRRCTRFELVVACVWRCRTIALSPNPDEQVQFSTVVNVGKRLNPPLPAGYYGNLLIFPTVVTTAGKLMENSLDYAVELVRKTKSDATEEYMRSVMDLMAVDHRGLAVSGSYMAADQTHSGLEEVDYGWGKAVYGGTATVGMDRIPGLLSFVTAFKDKKGENGIAVPMCLPSDAMDVFTEELEKMVVAARKGVNLTRSAL